jgi:tetratricopeptide (TPR) repeat protein
MRSSSAPLILAMTAGFALLMPFADTASGQSARSAPAAEAIARGNAAYGAQDYRTAATAYEEALRRNASNADLFFFLANSLDNLYTARLKGDPLNDSYLARALDSYQTAVRGGTPGVRRLALQYLVQAYVARDKADDPAAAEQLLLEMIDASPDEVTNTPCSPGCTKTPAIRQVPNSNCSSPAHGSRTTPGCI